MEVCDGLEYLLLKIKWYILFLQGHHVFEVPDGHKLKITSGNAGQ